MIRNNNPGNIRASGDRWQGMTGKDSRGFVIFSDLDHGYRALYKLLINYIGQGNNTISKIITKWAPPSENDTKTYINNVSRRTKLDPNQAVKPSDLYIIGIAISLQEHGKADNDAAKNGLLMATAGSGSVPATKPTTGVNNLPFILLVMLGAGLFFLLKKA